MYSFNYSEKLRVILYSRALNEVNNNLVNSIAREQKGERGSFMRNKSYID